MSFTLNGTIRVVVEDDDSSEVFINWGEGEAYMALTPEETRALGAFTERGMVVA